jgi:cytochrome oxidase Cu insertion factor (SCO1/SenC/PrrC family)
MNNSTVPYWLSLMVLIAASYGGWKWYQVQEFQTSREVGGVTFDGPPLEEFELTERSGKAFRSADLKGKVWVTSFFFASCAGQCPRLNANIKHLHDDPELKEVTWVSITVDPDNDTPEVLQEYADRYQADPERWLFCRGEFDYIKRVGEDIMKMEVTWRGHKDYAIVIDREGKVRGMFDATSISQSKKLRVLLLECLSEIESTDEIAQVDRGLPASARN